MFKKIVDAFFERFNITGIQKHILDRRVPKTSWYQGDGAALAMLFSVQVLTGMFMALGYTNSVDGAYESVQRITDVLILGWLVRALHYWSAGMMVLVLVFHLFRHLLLGGYKAPREGIWIIGVMMFFLVLTMSFTGYTLRWDERAVYAIRVVLNMFYNVPFIGEELVLLVQGGQEIGQATLSRFFSIHVVIVPFILSALLGYHLYLVITKGVTSKAERNGKIKTKEEQDEIYKAAKESKKGGEWFFPKTALSSTLTGFVWLLVALFLALILGPAPLYPEANLVEPSFPQEEWWFYWYSSLIALMPPKLAPAFLVGFPIFVFVFLLSLPFLDRGPNRGIKHRPVWSVFVAILTISLLALSALRKESPWTGWPSSKLMPIPEGVKLTTHAQRGRELFTTYGCNSCHAIAGKGRQVGPDLAQVEKRMSTEDIREFILNPPSGVPMPRYEGKLTGEELERIMEFVHVAQTFPLRQKTRPKREEEDE